MVCNFDKKEYISGETATLKVELDNSKNERDLGSLKFVIR